MENVSSWMRGTYLFHENSATITKVIFSTACQCVGNNYYGSITKYTLGDIWIRQQVWGLKTPMRSSSLEWNILKVSYTKTKLTSFMRSRRMMFQSKTLGVAYPLMVILTKWEILIHFLTLHPFNIAVFNMCFGNLHHSWFPVWKCVCSKRLCRFCLCYINCH